MLKGQQEIEVSCFDEVLTLFGDKLRSHLPESSEAPITSLSLMVVYIAEYLTPSVQRVDAENKVLFAAHLKQLLFHVTNLEDALLFMEMTQVLPWQIRLVSDDLLHREGVKQVWGLLTGLSYLNQKRDARLRAEIDAKAEVRAKQILFEAYCVARKHRYEPSA